MSLFLNLFALCTQWIIIAAFAAGVVCIITSCIRARKSMYTLNECRRRYRVPGAWEKASPTEDAALHFQKSDHLLNDHLLNRINALEVALKARNPERGERAEFPSLSDLHAITQYREQSHRDVSSMHMIISILLILGILGTLTGIHEIVENEHIALSALREALLPSMYAVFFTVILIIARSLLYSRVFNLYTAELDEYTLSVILPVFRAKNMGGNIIVDHQRWVEDLSKSLDEVGEWVGILREVKIPDSGLKEISFGTIREGKLNKCMDKFGTIEPLGTPEAHRDKMLQDFNVEHLLTGLQTLVAERRTSES